MAGPPLLSLRISARYPGAEPVLEDSGFQLAQGEILGLVGRSGEGKSTIALAILNLLSHKGGVASGEILFQGKNLLALSERAMRDIRGRAIAFIPQSPVAALNPALTIGTQIREAWSAHSREPYAAGEPRVRELLASVSLPAEPEFLDRYPRELSVGLAQRVLIAMSLLHRPALLVADEPTSALDMITQSEVLAVLGRINRDMRTAILYISHDLVSVAALCHRVAIFHHRGIVECAPVEQIFRAPQHPYTKKLIEAIPRIPF